MGVTPSTQAVMRTQHQLEDYAASAGQAGQLQWSDFSLEVGLQQLKRILTATQRVAVVQCVACWRHGQLEAVIEDNERTVCALEEAVQYGMIDTLEERCRVGALQQLQLVLAADAKLAMGPHVVCWQLQQRHARQVLSASLQLQQREAEIEMLEHTRDDNEGTISVLEEVAQYGEEMEERCYELIHVCRVAAVQLLVKIEVAQQHKSLTKVVLLWYSHNARAMEQRTREANEASIVQLEDLIEVSLHSMLSDATK